MSDTRETWYHGSPLELEILKKGSSITRMERLAGIFSTRPEIVSAADDGTIRHNGRLKGKVYRVAGPVSPDDIREHPSSTMQDGWEWLTNRELKLELLYEYSPSPEDILSEDEINELKLKMKGMQNV
ncbi:MAG: hypothetical protein JW712_00470 [Dehalococcoidales bacterium]|nr:hypothetical protein [Dehalococcoidales bacterium]